MFETYQKFPNKSRLLLNLAAATLLMVILAIWSLSSTVERQRPEFEPRIFFSGFGAQMPNATRLEITGEEGTLVAERGADGGWVLPEKGGYPIKLDPLRQAFEGLRTLKKEAAKTANAGWHEALELGDPAAGGKGTKVTAKSADGTVLAEIILGKRVETQSITGPTLRHARVPGDDQTWLVSGALSGNTDIADWIDTGFLGLTGDEVRDAIIRVDGKQSYVLSRSAPDQSDFKLEPVPEGKKAKANYTLRSTANALVGLVVDDVRARDGVMPDAKTPTVIYRTFDGLVITARTIAEGDAAWLIMDASVEAPTGGTDAGDPDAGAARTARANAINNFASRFAFKVPSYKAEQIVKPLNDLVEPLSGN